MPFKNLYSSLPNGEVIINGINLKQGTKGVGQNLEKFGMYLAVDFGRPQLTTYLMVTEWHFDLQTQRTPSVPPLAQSAVFGRL